jgi:uroporphyrinogen III methyltransferase/synthase
MKQGIWRAVKSSLPLKGCRILLTREHDQAAALSRMLRERGARPVECPTIRFSPPADWSPVDRCIERLNQYDGLLFTSVNAVNFFLGRLEETGTPLTSLLRIPCFTIGPATGRALTRRKIPVKAIPDRYQAEGFLALLEKEDLRGKRFLLPRAREAREILTHFLEEHSVSVDVAVVYETRKAIENQELLMNILRMEPLEHITFTSTSTARFFGEMAGDEPLSSKWKLIPAACIGDITANAVRSLGFRTVITAQEATLEGLVQALVDYEAARKQPNP